MNLDRHDIFGYLAVALMALGMFPYVKSIVFTKKTHLNVSSWAIWASLGIINAFAYAKAGERETLGFVILSATNPTIIFLLSLKYGIKKWEKEDKWCLMFAVVAIASWKLSGNPVLAIASCVAADIFALYPLYKKVLRDPYSENLLGWIIALSASICNVVAIKQLTWANGIYMGYAVSAFILITAILFRGQCFKKGSTRTSVIVGGFVFKFVNKLPVPPGKKEGMYVEKNLFWHGLIGNVSEFGVSISYGSVLPFIARTYFGIGLLNIQKRIRGKQPTSEEVKKLLNNLSKEAYRDICWVAPHQTDPHNFIIDEKGWHVVDYGDRFSDTYGSFSGFLFKHREELTKHFQEMK